MNEHELFKRFRQIDEIFNELTQGLGQVDGVVGGMVTDYQRTRKEWMTHAIQSQAINTLRFYCSWINVIPIIGPLVSLFIMRDSNVQKMSKKVLKETIAFQAVQQKALEEDQKQRQIERKNAYMKLREPYTITCRGARGKRKEDITEYKIYVARGEGEQAPPVGNDDEGFDSAELLATVKAVGEDVKDEYYWNNWEPGYQYRIWVIGNTNNGDLERQVRGHSFIYQFPTGGELLKKEGERLAKEALLEAKAKKAKADKERAAELGVSVAELPHAEAELKKKSEPGHQMELKRGNGDKPIDYERKVAQIESPTRGKDE